MSDSLLDLTEPLVAYRRLLGMVASHIELERKLQGDYAVALGCDTVPTTTTVAPAPDKTADGQMQSSLALSLTPAPTNAQAVAASLLSLSQQAAVCSKCKLAKTRTQVVFGAGSAHSRLIIVGEAPGHHEDVEGVPFVGEAGKLLTKMLAAIELTRADVYICNVVKCRPPQNREPEPEEIAACRSWLTGQLTILRPKLICAMGKFACQAITGISQPVYKYRDQIFYYQGIPVICTYHPAHLLYHPDEKSKSWQDLKKIRQFLDSQ